MTPSYSFIAGEYGFLDSVNDYALFLGNADRAGCGGSMVWSLRPHSHRGGFMVSVSAHLHLKYNAEPCIPDTPRRRDQLRISCARLAESDSAAIRYTARLGYKGARCGQLYPARFVCYQPRSDARAIPAAKRSACVGARRRSELAGIIMG